MTTGDSLIWIDGLSIENFISGDDVSDNYDDDDDGIVVNDNGD